ncbi:MAG TPA: response regulator [Pyrinomonadaceae bacterium]|nr:response regulator [Pyrinomonadaceae bacterium]
MSTNAPLNSAQASGGTTAQGARRALVVADEAGLSLQQRLTVNGYVTRAATIADSARAINEFAPDVVIIVVAHTDSDVEHETVAFARKLRAETSTYSLPIVFTWNEDHRALRTAAQYIGADDYFSLATPTTEILARLDSLFWRVESGRRSAPVVSDQRLEIDNFMFMLDAVREDARAGLSGTIALVYAAAARGREDNFDKAVRDHTLSRAHGFLKLNLRRVDAVAYYGPTALLLYLPRMDARSAVAALSRLHREFLQENSDRNIIAGLASFPDHGSDVEGLIEKAEAAVNHARSTAKQVVAYESSMKVASALPKEPQREMPKETKAPAIPSTPATSPSAEREHEREPLRESAPETVPASEPAPVSNAKRSDARMNAAAAMSAEEIARSADEAAAHERDRRASGTVMPRRLLLTVSDSARMTQINSLIRSAGYEARAAFDGQQALHLLRIERPDLLLLDYELQGIDGLETIRRLRKQSGGRLSLPVIMILSTENERARREALELGAHSVFVTPYDPAEFLASVRRAGSSE